MADVIRHYGDATRAARVATALVDRLRTDPRLQAAYEDAARLADAALVETEPAGVDAEASRRVHRRLEQLRDELGLVHPWLVALLARDFMAWLLTRLVAHEQPGEVFAARIDLTPPDRDLVPDLPNGQAPYVDIARDVDWLYRATIADPPETLYAIAKADLPFKGPAPNHTVVRTAIRRTEAALRMLDVDGSPV